jgi:transcription elongation factor
MAKASGKGGHVSASGKGGHVSASGKGGHVSASGKGGHVSASGKGGHVSASGSGLVSTSSWGQVSARPKHPEHVWLQPLKGVWLRLPPGI